MSRQDNVLMFLVFSLTLFGFFMLSSASAPYAILKHSDSYYFVKKQLTHGLLPGLALFLFFLKINYRLLRRLANYIFIFGVALLTLVFIPGLGVSFGTVAKSWVKLGGFSFQPSEISKLCMIIFFSAWLEHRRGAGFSPKDTLWQFLIFLGIFSGLILAQPDMGTAGIFILTGLLMYFAYGAPLRYFGGIFLAAIAGFFILIKISPYKINRFIAFLDPSRDPQGIGYHILQSILAIGSGGFFGVGLGYSRQKFQYLPEVWADSIFPVIGEELGFVISALLVLAFILFLTRALKIAKKAPDEFGFFLSIGISGWIVFQAFINIGAMLSLMPLTGVPLPFISYGGTALVSVLAASGILLNISRSS